MNEDCTEFDESVRDIEGLTDFRPKKIPLWFRQRLIDTSCATYPADISDEELVEAKVACHGYSGWLGQGHEEVFILTAYDDTQPIDLAIELDCGLMLVELSNLSSISDVLYASRLYPVPRRQRDAAVA